MVAETRESIRSAFVDRFQSLYAKNLEEGANQEYYQALVHLMKDDIGRNWAKTNSEYESHKAKQVYYFSIEFLPGRLLKNYLLSMGVEETCREALADLSLDLEAIYEEETELGIGSGGLGRLASCFLDSMASMRIPGHGCGIRYKYGQFRQQLVEGYQVELPDGWLKHGNPWETVKRSKTVEVRFGGHVWSETIDGRLVFHHENYEPVLAVPYDIPLVGYGNTTVNTLRLWSAEAATDGLDRPNFNRDDYLKSVEYKYSVESITEILYPDDSNYHGRVLRLKQQYFFVSAGIQSIVRYIKKKTGSVHYLDDLAAIHINDTHPVLVIPELMRILMDEEGFEWDEAWQMVISMVSYTNHTVLPEAMEKWPEDILKTLLPRIYMIIAEINARFCRELDARYGADSERIREMAIIQDGYVHMAHLAVIASSSVNGVAKIHTEILKKDVLRPFFEYRPYKFNNKTNGITHRRWLLQANPELAKVISQSIGGSWINHPEDLNKLLRFVNDDALQEAIAQVKKDQKIRLADYIQKQYNLQINPASVFDVHIKRIHAYKRQLLKLFHVIYLYNAILEKPQQAIMPRTVIFAGKAAPGYYLAKNIIKLITSVADKINHDPIVGDQLRVLFMENYSVSLAERIIPAADISEQISTASKEASGTGNMKLMMNGALTIGTLDGANIEIRDEVGPENFFSFGLSAEEVLNYHLHGGYSARQTMEKDPQLSKIIEQLSTGFFSNGRDCCSDVLRHLIDANDEFFVLRDFAAYLVAQQDVETAHQDQRRWRHMSAVNIARSGHFSSDRTVSEYAVGIWKVRPLVLDN